MNIIGKMKRSGLNRDGQEGSAMFYHVVVKARTKWISAGSWCAESDIFSKTCARLSLGRNGKRCLDFAVSGCYTFKTPSSFLVQPFGTSEFLGGNWESLGHRVTSVTLDLALLNPRFQTQTVPFDSDTFGAALGNLEGSSGILSCLVGTGWQEYTPYISVQTLQIVSLKWSIYANMTAIQYARMPRKKIVTSLRLVDLHGPRR